MLSNPGLMTDFCSADVGNAGGMQSIDLHCGVVW